MKLTFLDFKHNYNQRPFTLVLHRQPTSCPIQLLIDYFALRGNKPGLFSKHNLGLSSLETPSFLEWMQLYVIVALILLDIRVSQNNW